MGLWFLRIVEMDRRQIRHGARAIAGDLHAVVGDDVVRDEVTRDADLHHPQDLGLADLDIFDDPFAPVLGRVIEHGVVREHAAEHLPVLRVHARGEAREQLGDVEAVRERTDFGAQFLELAHRRVLHVRLKRERRAVRRGPPAARGRSVFA